MKKQTETTNFLGGYGTKSVPGKTATMNPLQQKAAELKNKGGLAGEKPPDGWKVNSEGFWVIKEPVLKDKKVLPGIGTK